MANIKITPTVDQRKVNLKALKLLAKDKKLKPAEIQEALELIMDILGIKD